MSNKWRLYCENESDKGWKYFRSTDEDATPVCPNNSEHTISNISKVSYEKEIMNLHSLQQMTYDRYLRISVFKYLTSIYGDLRRVKILCNKSNKINSATFEIFDVTNNVSLIEKTFTETGNDIILNVGTITNPPTSDAIIEINCKVEFKDEKINTGIQILQIIICSE